MASTARKPEHTSDKNASKGSELSSDEIMLNNKVRMPAVGLGTWRLKEPDQVKKIVTEAIKVGYRRIDTAPNYDNEEHIGDIITDRDLLAKFEITRHDLFMVTKVDPECLGYEPAKESVKRSMERLKTPYLDLVILHWPGPKKGEDVANPENSKRRKEAWHALEELYNHGRLRAIGVSNYKQRHLEEMFKYCKVMPAVNQVEFHPLCVNKDLHDFCDKHNIHLQGYSPLASEEGKQELFEKEELKELAKRKNKTIPQILLKWSRKHGLSFQAKTANPNNLKVNLDLDGFDLTEEEVKLVDNFNEDKHFCENPEKIR